MAELDNGREALAARLAEALTDGDEHGVYATWLKDTERLADAILAGGALFLPNGLDVERLALVIRSSRDWEEALHYEGAEAAAKVLAREYAAADREGE